MHPFSSQLFGKIIPRTFHLSEVRKLLLRPVEPLASSLLRAALLFSASRRSLSSSASMTLWSHLLSALVLLSFFGSAWCSPMCNNQCCRFVEDFPVRLKKLREDYSQIRGFFEANDDLDTALLDQSVEDSFKVSFPLTVLHYARNAMLLKYDQNINTA
ncbi:hypothetical protein EYF80_026489 [Liparis tanakae]|uniref:Interleukin family protein n=1 Tax=Liparis tanakae TaxID=230148 RepID=A0A4Z2HE95_9TELE|nr:hypothetical protein EYF80_026489 [Liparis tanakae]